MRIITGQFKNRTIKSPKGLVTRPTSEKLRAALFNMIQFDVEGALFLDLFAGSGAVGLEALSRGAARSIFVDNSREAFKSIMANVELLGVKEHCEVYAADVFKAVTLLEKGKKVFDIIYADPPYDTKGYAEKLVLHIDQSGLLKAGGQFFVEEAVGVPCPKEGLATLVLKSERRVGQSALYQYVKEA